MQEETSNTWLQSIQGGDPQATGWNLLLASYGPFVRKILIHYGLEDSHADDVVQNVMAIVVKKLPEFERQRAGSFRTWLRAITLNCFRDHLKSKQYRSRAPGGTDMLDLAHAMEDRNSEFTKTWNRAHSRHVLDELLKAVAPDFTPQSIEVFNRLALQSEPVDQVAESLGITVNACFIARSRVLKRLKAVRQEVFGDDQGLSDVLG